MTQTGFMTVRCLVSIVITSYSIHYTKLYEIPGHEIVDKLLVADAGKEVGFVEFPFEKMTSHMIPEWRTALLVNPAPEFGNDAASEASGEFRHEH